MMFSLRNFAIQISLVFLLLSNVFTLTAQQNANVRFWKDVEENTLSSDNAQRLIKPAACRTIKLESEDLKTWLENLPHEADLNAKIKGQELLLPHPDGTLGRYMVWYSPIMATELANKYPGIRTYAGKSLDRPGTNIRFDMGPKGFHAMISGPDLVAYIDPYRQGDIAHYQVYSREDFMKTLTKKHHCLLETESLPVDTDVPEFKTLVGDCGIRHEYRLAVAATGEYTNFHGGTVELALAAIVTSVNRVNMIMENEIAVRLKLIADNDKLIYTNGATDPYTNGKSDIMIGENQENVTQVIGNQNYDMGHVFGTNTELNGLAGLGVVCNLFSKARGVTSSPAPVGDPFDVDVVCHEMGHQFDASHAQYNTCNRNEPTAIEPGSASTIMGYAGICPPNVQNSSDPYYNTVSLYEMRTYISTGQGASCDNPINVPNEAPLVQALPNYNIPISTPFELTAVASDPDGTLSYCWEQINNWSGTDMPMPPVSTNASGPLFRSRPPVSSPTRTFPNLQSLITNINSTWEKLPSVGRTMNFRVTVRDNVSTAGCTGEAETVVTSVANAGPFVVAYPNSSQVKLNVGDYEVIRWNVANTNRPPINCSSVNIRLSTDGGFNYPHLIAAGVPNNGLYCFKVPNLISNSCRIRVEAVNNIFFDISNANFGIISPTKPEFSLCLSNFTPLVCLPYTYNLDVQVDALLGYDKPVTLSVEGVNPNGNAVFSSNTVLPGNTVTLQLSYNNNQTEGIDTFIIKAVSDTLSTSFEVQASMVRNFFNAMEMEKPLHGEKGVSVSPWLHWKGVPDANTYDVQLASAPDFNAGSILAQGTVAVDSFKVPILLAEGTTYYWRLRPKNECGDGSWMGPHAFGTRVEVCSTFSAGDLPKNISANGTPTVESKITVMSNALVSDVNIKRMEGNHSAFKDLDVSLIAPNGATTLLFKNRCGSFNGSFKFGFDDLANTGLSCPPNTNGTIFKPTESFQNLLGQNAAGVWTLQVKDVNVSAGGSLGAFELELCSAVSLTGPQTTVNLPLILPQPGAEGIIGSSLLKTEDLNTPTAALEYTLVTLPEGGTLKRSGTALNVGDKFTQADIDNDQLVYSDAGTNPDHKSFRFAVSDGEKGMDAGIFRILLQTVGVSGVNQENKLKVSPNPASTTLTVQLELPLTEDARLVLFDAVGRALRSETLNVGQATHTLNVMGLPAGMYTLWIYNNKYKAVGKVLIGTF